MQVNNSVDGMMRAKEAMDQASANITKKLTPGNDSDVTKDVAMQRVAKAEFAANLRVSKVQDDMLGEVIDIVA